MINVASKNLMDILCQKPAYNGLLLNVVERNCHDDWAIKGNSIRTRDKSSGLYMFSVGTWPEVKDLMEEAENRLDTFLINDCAYTHEVHRKYPYAYIKEYQSFVLLAKDYTPYYEINREVEMVPLDLSWLDFILERYHDEEFGHEAYITHRLLHGPGLGLLYQGKKVAFAMQHKNGEIGPVVVDPMVRGMGFGTYLLRHLNNILLEKNSILVSLSAPSNKASAKMVMNSGYQPTDRNVIWVYRKLNNTLYLP